MILHFSQNAKKKTSRKKEVFFYGKLLFSKRTSLVKGRGTIAILAMVEGFIIKIFVIKERIPQSFLTASG